MKYALVCKNEPRETGYRVAEVLNTKAWEAATEHFWVECPDDLTIDSKWFDPSDNTFKDFATSSEFTVAIAADGQPTTTGTQTI